MLRNRLIHAFSSLSSAMAFAAETMVVTASRGPEDLRSLPASVTIISRQDIDQLAGAGQGLSSVLAQLVPGIGPETRSVSNFGQQLQGRKVLILIDGIPQSENRQVSRQLSTIQTASIQRIEVIAGATAIYGADAIGGVINIITRDYAALPLQQETRIQFSSSDKASLKDSGALQIEHTASGGLGASHYLATISLEKQAGSYDAHGQLLPPEPAQTSRDQTEAAEALLKYAYDIAERQRLELSFSAYKDRQDLDYTAAKDPYHAVHGLELDEQPMSERQQLALRYQQEGFEATVYQRSRRYRFFPFALSKPLPLVNQSTSLSQAMGARLQWDFQSSEAWRWITGVDYERERGQQTARAYDYDRYAASNGLVYEPVADSYDYGPEVTTEKLSPFLQGKWSLSESSHAQAGFRYELIRQDIADFTPPLETAMALNYEPLRRAIAQMEASGQVPSGTTASLPAAYERAPYAGGTKEFHASVWNLGYSFNPDTQQQFFVNYAQGYELADTARLMRDAVAPGSLLPLVGRALKLNVKTSTTDDLDVATIYTQSVNAGYSRRTRGGTQSLNVFFNQSDKTYRFNRDFSVDLLHQLQQAYGFETVADLRLSPRAVLGGSYTMGWGRYRQDQRWLRLSAVEVNPPKLVLSSSHALGSRSSLRLQTTQIFSQRGSERSGLARFRGYSSEDLFFASQLTEQSQLRFGVRNLFNHDYKTVFHQWAEKNYGPESGTPASGRRLSLGYELVF